MYNWLQIKEIASLNLEKEMLNTKIEVGSKFVNKNNGGQLITVTDTKFQGNDGVIGYKLHDSFRFNSVAHSNCDIESFEKTFSDID